MTPPPLLSIQSVRKTYRHNGVASQVLRDVSLDIFPGEHMGLIGQSGAGKSTLTRLILGVEPVSAGHIFLEGKPVKAYGKTLKQRVQIIFQDPTIYLNPYFTVEKTVGEPLAVFYPGLKARQRRDRVAGLLGNVGLDAVLMQRKPHELSGGQCQRVAIARALSLKPSLLICDEPFTNIDGPGRAGLMDLFEGLSNAFDLTYLLISHDLAIVQRMCHRTAVMKEGRLVACDTTHDLLRAPRHGYVKTLVAAYSGEIKTKIETRG